MKWYVDERWFTLKKAGVHLDVDFQDSADKN